jgi:hypothetical protein
MKFLTVFLLALAFSLLIDLGFAWLFAIALNNTFALHLHALHLWLLVVVTSGFIGVSTTKPSSKK